MARRTLQVLVLVSVPLLAATGAMLWVAASERADHGFFARSGPRNSAEAAAMGQAVAMLQFLRIDNDSTRVHPVRPEIISPQVRWVTTLEAAVWSRHEETIAILDREGFLPAGEMRRYLACLALDLERQEIASYLSPAATCVEGEAIKQVTARAVAGEDVGR